MSAAALHLPGLWAAAATHSPLRIVTVDRASAPERQPASRKKPVQSLAFYRKHTNALLRRYLYASMLIGRAPSLLDHPVARGWASSRPVRTFEDAVNFVLDVERCLARLGALDRCLLNRLVLQEYTLLEVSIMLRISVNTVAAQLGKATDRLTQILLKEALLVLTQS
ncbi:hypothetical protein DYQ86_13375 [Acidobacteria bacterium AB60]|nr:hypothetical protein DYQ86_13375 [Acidobacteria bacterium AB60]